MLTPKNNAFYMRTEMLVQVAKSYLKDRLVTADEIPETIYPQGAKPARGSLEKDREITKMRAMAVMGIDVTDENNWNKSLNQCGQEALARTQAPKNKIMVIRQACAACMKPQHIVSNLCRACFARPCEVNCPKKAIKVTDKASIDTSLCINCGICKEACPYDAIISDALNHASIIDGVRLCKAVRYRYANADMDALEDCLKRAQAQRFRIICTDGVFSMDGNAAPLDRICELAERYRALVMVDECHSAGVLGRTGRGITELYDLRGKVDIITGTLGKAFGGAVGGFTTGRAEIIDMLRQRSRPYLFSNSLPPAVVGAGIELFKMLAESDELHDRLVENVAFFRERMIAAGFDIKPTDSAICAVMLYDAKLSQEFAAALQEEGVFVTGFYYPVVPKGLARIRVQVSAGHTREQLERCVDAFVRVGRRLGVLKQ